MSQYKVPDGFKFSRSWGELFQYKTVSGTAAVFTDEDGNEYAVAFKGKSVDGKSTEQQIQDWIDQGGLQRAQARRKQAGK